ncbi:MAG: glutathione peroxidase [Pseudomonadota bacterium]
MFNRRYALMVPFALAMAPARAAAPGFSFANIDGGQIDLQAYRGKPILVVNTASHCVFTKQYDALQQLHDDYGDRLLVLAVPSDDFGGQEYGTEAEVKRFCEVNFNLTLPLTEITRVKGPEAHPFYVWAAKNGVRPAWNFHKVLLDGEGRIVRDFPSTIGPQSARLRRAIDALLET